MTRLGVVRFKVRVETNQVMKHGFKSASERRSISVRAELGLKPADPLSARQLAAYLNVAVLGVDQVPGVTPALLGHLLGSDPESWSAFTVAPPEMTLIVLNTAHSPARQESDLMHEASHLLCEHEPSELVTIPGLDLPIRTFNKAQEEEADWLAGCLLLPRPVLELAMRRGLSDFQIAEEYGASYQMIRYRRGVTGVALQKSRWKGRRQPV